ncbi:MAG: DUF4860 domain-containing protein [Clostridia bacterium]
MMKRRARGFGWMSGAMMFVLLGLFALLSTMLILVGAQAYQRVVLRSQAHAQEQILVGYVMNKARVGEHAGGLRIEDAQGVQALVVSQRIDEAMYETWIYCRDGQLYEQFKAEEDAFDPEYGEALCAAASFTPKQTGARQYLFEMTAQDGAKYEAHYTRRAA